MNLLTQVKNCRDCSLGGVEPVIPLELSKRNLMIVAGMPDAESDLVQEVLAGLEGRLLAKILVKSGIHREAVHFTYAAKCLGGSATVCRHWLVQEIGEVEPQVIVSMGIEPTALLLNIPRSRPMKRLVGTHHDFLRAKLVVWHSAAAIRNNLKLLDPSVQFFKSVKETLRVTR